MSLWNPLDVIRSIFPDKSLAANAASRWTAIFEQDPRAMEDLIRLGGLLETNPETYDGDGIPVPAPIDPVRLAYERGRSDMARQLLALGSLDAHTLKNLLES